MSNRAKVLERMYRKHLVTEEGLKKAVKDGTITEEEYIEIVGLK